MKLLSSFLLLTALTVTVDASTYRSSPLTNSTGAIAATRTTRTGGDDDDDDDGGYHPAPHPTNHPVPHPTYHPVPHPTYHPVPHPTYHPVPHPTYHPVPAPTYHPVPAPTYHPVPAPTYHPTPHPTPLPTHSPTPDPTPAPTPQPTPARLVTTWTGIQLLPNSEVAPFMGVEFASGQAEIDVIYEEDREGTDYLICIRATIYGFTPELLHVHNALIFDNGVVFADMTNLIDGDSPIDGCVDTTKQFYDLLLADPDRFYLNAHVAPTPDELFKMGVRGQLLQAFTAALIPQESVSPFLGVPGSSGSATIRFEAGGSKVCFDAKVTGFDPAAAHLQYGQVGQNGGIVFDFSSTKVGLGRFFGCLTIAELDTSLTVVSEILADGYLHYFKFHQSADPNSLGFFNTIRGQLPEIN